MHSLGKYAAGIIALLSAAAFSHSGCGEPPYIGGQCEVDGDCNTKYQTVPGTGCVDGRCQCLDPAQTICCARGEMPPDCFLSCRPCSECALGTEGCPMGCQSDEECPGPGDARCGAGRCVAGKCQLEIHPGPLASQLRGDCQRLDCSAAGEVEAIADPSDWYNDGNQCTTDYCAANGPSNDPLANGTTCPEAGSGICYDAECVQCYAIGWQTECTPLACDGKYCVPGHCVDNDFDPSLGETDLDCGGPCRPCAPGRQCSTGSDCREGVCKMGVCQSPTCVDGVKNDAETGVDCGAPSCPLCAPGQGCVAPGNCTSGVCWAATCEAPTCSDGVANGEETGIDCGPPCTVACP